MIISLIPAWCAVICTLLTAFQLFAKKIRNVRKLFHRLHIPLGILLITFGIIHGLLAGNRPGTSMTQAIIGQALFTWNMGTVCLILAILLGMTYLLRKVLHKNWIRLHRLLTVLLLAAIVIHVCQVGITLPTVLKSSIQNLDESQSISEVEAETARTWGNTSVSTADSIEEVTPSSSTAAANTEAPTESADAAAEITADNPYTQSVEASASESTASESAIDESAANISEGSLPDDSEAAAADENPVTFSGAELADGVYEGSADGYRGTITVSVTVENGAVTDILVTDEHDTDEFFQQAEEIMDTILDEQTLEVDGVSGATYSSRGIRDAVYNALQAAVISGELNISEIQVSNVHGGH